MKLKNRIYDTKLIEWQHVKDIQPHNLKIPYNYDHLKQSILKYGIAKAYDVCVIDNQMYWIDGHTRTDILKELLSDGVEIPKKLTANFCEVANMQEAISILLDVHNQRQNPIDQEVFDEWRDEVDFDVNEIALNIKPAELDLTSETDLDENEEKGISNKSWFLNIRCDSEQHAQELYEQFISKGLDVKIIT